MYKAVKTSLVNAGRVTELLIERFGAKQVRQVEQRGERVFRVRLNTGDMAFAFVQGDGSVSIYNTEGT